MTIPRRLPVSPKAKLEMVGGGKQAFRPIEKPEIIKPAEQGGLEPPQPPPGASADERLLYPAGLLGHVVQHIVDVDMFPDRRMANWLRFVRWAKPLTAR